MTVKIALYGNGTQSEFNSSDNAGNPTERIHSIQIDDFYLSFSLFADGWDYEFHYQSSQRPEWFLIKLYWSHLPGWGWMLKP